MGMAFILGAARENSKKNLFHDHFGHAKKFRKLTTLP
jgi:hypothetical protein